MAAADSGGADRAGHTVALVLFHLAFWVPLLACTYLALIPDPPDNPVFRLSDVILHGAAFTYLTFALVLVLLSGRNAARPFLGIGLLSFAAMLGYGLFLELVQYFIPERTAELKDVMVDMVGIVIGLSLAWLLGRWIRDLVANLSAGLLGWMR